MLQTVFSSTSGDQQPSPHMQGWVHTTNMCFYLSLSHSLFLRGVVQSVYGEVPFLSVSGRLQRSVIREIDGTAPISCLVPFESAKLLRTSKKMSQFMRDLFVH